MTRTRQFMAGIDRLFTHMERDGEDAALPWKAVRRVRRTGLKLVFDRCSIWSRSSNPIHRMRAAEVLCQLGYKRRRKGERWSMSPRPFRDAVFALFVDMLPRETDARVLRAILTGFGHLRLAAAIPLLAPYASDADPSTRYAVVFGLGQFGQEALAVEALTPLIDDSDREVRDWAIFYVGVLGDADSLELREVFVRHLSDSYRDARMEAAAALGKRKDSRVLAPLFTMLRHEGLTRALEDAVAGLLDLSSVPDSWNSERCLEELEQVYGAV